MIVKTFAAVHYLCEQTGDGCEGLELFSHLLDALQSKHHDFQFLLLLCKKKTDAFHIVACPCIQIYWGKDLVLFSGLKTSSGCRELYKDDHIR